MMISNRHNIKPRDSGSRTTTRRKIKKNNAETFNLNSMEKREGHNPQICYRKTIHSTSLAILNMIKILKSKLIYTNLQNC